MINKILLAISHILFIRFLKAHKKRLQRIKEIELKTLEVNYDKQNTRRTINKGKMNKELKPIVGQHLLSFPENSPCPFELYIKDGHNLILFNPDGDSKIVSKGKFLAVLIKLFDEK